jgi:hypothetical protein
VKAVQTTLPDEARVIKPIGDEVMIAWFNEATEIFEIFEIFIARALEDE